jgi:type IV secretion system protein VirD4
VRERDETLYRLPAPREARTAVGWVMLASGMLAAVEGGIAASSWIARALSYAPALGRAWLVRPCYPDRLSLLSLVAVGGLAATLAWFPRSRPGALLVVSAGLPLVFVALGPIYSPLQALTWIHRYGAAPRLAVVMAQGKVAWLVGFLPGFAATLAYGALALGRLRRVGDLHGSSHWASVREVAAANLLDDGAGGVVIGHLGRRMLCDHKDRHTLVYAPSGAGKSTCLVIPTLLRWEGSLVALDIKGELWETTAGYRQASGQLCVRFDPTLRRGSASYNPVAAIPRSDEDVAYAQDVADILVSPEGREAGGSERFFEDSSRALLTGVLLHVLYTDARPSLGACLHLLSTAEPAEVWKQMRTAAHDPTGRRGWTDRETGGRTTTHPTVEAAASRLLGMDFRTATGVVATAQSKLVLWEDGLVAANTTESDFSGTDLIASNQPVSVYLTVAPANLDRMRPLLRVVLNQLTRQLTLRPGGNRRPVLLMLDELPALGRLDFMARGIGYFRGFGVRVYISIQSLEQLVEIYGPHQSIASNCSVQIAYGANDTATARLLSELTGKRTVEYFRESRNRTLVGGRRTEAEAETGRPLLAPDEIRRLPGDEALIYVAGCAPIRGHRVPYWRDRRLADRVAMRPPSASDRVPRTVGGRTMPP